MFEENEGADHQSFEWTIFWMNLCGFSSVPKQVRLGGGVHLQHDVETRRRILVFAVRMQREIVRIHFVYLNEMVDDFQRFLGDCPSLDGVLIVAVGAKKKNKFHHDHDRLGRRFVLLRNLPIVELQENRIEHELKVWIDARAARTSAQIARQHRHRQRMNELEHRLCQRVRLVAAFGLLDFGLDAARYRAECVGGRNC